MEAAYHSGPERPPAGRKRRDAGADAGPTAATALLGEESRFHILTTEQNRKSGFLREKRTFGRFRHPPVADVNSRNINVRQCASPH
jgi:hypothetical protein